MGFNSEIKKSPADAAKWMFQLASATAPVSVVSQAARIALECKSNNVRPIPLLRELLRREDLIEQIAANANSAHKNNPRVPRIEKGNVQSILFSDFVRAEHMLCLSPEQLEYIATTAYQEAPGRSGESERDRLVTEMVEQARRMSSRPR